MNWIRLFLICVSSAAWAAVFFHAFKVSVGAGLMALGIPGFNLYYAAKHFEHRFKPAILAVAIGAAALSAAI